MLLAFLPLDRYLLAQTVEPYYYGVREESKNSKDEEDSNREFRFRVGQSKIPYGFENLQSSSNRLTLDRNDPLNSGLANERDLGVLFYYAPKHVRKTFKYLVQSGLKGSGDYGMFGIGAYNGQTANSPEANDEPHAVARLTYPWKFNN